MSVSRYQLFSFSIFNIVIAAASLTIAFQSANAFAPCKTGEASMPLDSISVTSKFGPRIHPILKRKSFHAGIDLAAKLNDKVKAIFEGVVTQAGKDGALGNAVFISHPATKVTSIYGHLNKVAVSKGE